MDKHWIRGTREGLHTLQTGTPFKATCELYLSIYSEMRLHGNARRTV